MTKQTKTLTVLAAALVVCGGAYAALRAWNAQQAAADDTVYVTQLSDFTGLALTNGQGGSPSPRRRTSGSMTGTPPSPPTRRRWRIWRSR